MSYVILDLEWNGSYSKSEKRFINEIIEFGAVRTDDGFNVTGEFSELIYPRIGGRICSKVSKLTGITSAELKSGGIMFEEAVKRFTEFARGAVIVTWSTSDIQALIENYQYYTGSCRLPFLERYCNMQEFCEDCLNLHNPSSQLGLSSCAEILNIEFSEEEHHRALADAKMSLKCLLKFISRYDISSFVRDARTEEFYGRMMFKTHFITDMKNPEIDKSAMFFNCTACGRRTRRISGWRVRNKAFTSDFECKACGKKYLGRISYKKKYDEVVIHKKLTEKVEKPETAASV